MRRGFTLIELLIVVAIIAILAAIAVPNFLEAQVRSKVSRVKSDLRTVTTALESYYVDNNKYPPRGTYSRTATGITKHSGFILLLDPIWITTPISYITGHPVDAEIVNEAKSYSLRDEVGRLSRAKRNVIDEHRILEWQYHQ